MMFDPAGGAGVVIARPNYVELPVRDIAGSTAFFDKAFGWSLTIFGADYAATIGQQADLGLNGHETEGTAAPLPAIEVDDIAVALRAVEDVGGIITRMIFAFPGGRRFHFREPSGNELAVYVNEAG